MTLASPSARPSVARALTPRVAAALAVAHSRRFVHASLTLILLVTVGVGLACASLAVAQDRLPEPFDLAVTSAESAELTVDLSSHLTHVFSSEAKWKGYLEFLGKPGTARSLGQPDLFLPVLQDSNDLTFLNIRGQLQFDNTDNSETNIGLGHRHMFEEWILGGYGYYDRRNTQYGSAYNQFTGGLELMSVDWAFRVNGYLPENQTNTFTGDADVSVLPAGDSINVQVNGVVQERALPGLDGEVGYLLPIPWEAYTKVFDETRVYAGGYHFLGQDQFESVTGPRGRVEWRAYDLPVLGPGSRFMMGVEAQWDEPRGSQAFGLASLRIPLDVFSDKSTRKRLTGLDRRMLQPVIRDVDVVTNEYDVPTETLPALNQAGEVYQQVVEVDYTDEAALQMVLNDTDNQVGPTLIVPKHNGGMITLAAPIVLNTNQTLGGAGGRGGLRVGYHSQWLGRGSVGYTPDGAATGFLAGVGFPANNGLITMEPDSEVNGLTLDANKESTNGLRIRTVDEGGSDNPGTRWVANSHLKNSKNNTLLARGADLVVQVDNSEFSEVGGNGSGIALREGAVGHIRSSYFSNNSGYGISVYFGSSLTLSDSYVYNNGREGVFIFDDSHATISNSYIYKNGRVFSSGDGIDAQSGVTLELYDSYVYGNSDNGLFVGGPEDGSAPNTVTISNSHFYDNGSDGIELQAGSTVTISGSTIFDNASSGLLILFGADVTLSDSLISNNGTQGIHAWTWNGPVDDGDLTGNPFLDRIMDQQSTITLENVTITGNDGYGVLNEGSQVTVIKSRVSANATGSYANHLGVAEDGGTNYCIGNSGSLVVDGGHIPQTPSPLGLHANCDR